MPSSVGQYLRSRYSDLTKGKASSSQKVGFLVWSEFQLSFRSKRFESRIPVKQSRKLENLKFAQAMLRQICQTAQADGESLLTYLLDMAYLEASDRIRATWASKGNNAKPAP
ncbi:hypothetical protein AJ88_19415 [Mesorhizobium amorphae CCBAU 01583]|nr:hypothetical protein AJ88_19415 [Mesorhizobium amorphae CCBAU 01583]